jgi:HK97 gp10 family phage protein
MKVDVQIRGIDELKRELARLDAAVQTRLARNAAMAMARVVAKHARALAPVRTGALKKSIKARRDPERTRGKVQAFAGATVRYAHLVEFGHPFAAPRAFLRPALDNNTGEVEAKLIENLASGIDREVAKQTVPEDPGEV